MPKETLFFGMEEIMMAITEDDGCQVLLVLPRMATSTGPMTQEEMVLIQSYGLRFKFLNEQSVNQLESMLVTVKQIMRNKAEAEAAASPEQAQEEQMSVNVSTQGEWEEAEVIYESPAPKKPAAKRAPKSKKLN